MQVCGEGMCFRACATPHFLRLFTCCLCPAKPCSVTFSTTVKLRQVSEQVQHSGATGCAVRDGVAWGVLLRVWVRGCGWVNVGVDMSLYMKDHTKLVVLNPMLPYVLD